MNNFSYSGTVTKEQEQTLIKNVYMWMTAGLFITAVTAKLFAGSNLFYAYIKNPILMFGLIIAELVLVFRLSGKINKMSAQSAITTFLVYALLNGINLSTIFLAYNIGTISNAFFTTAATFGAMSLWAVTTKKDLSGWGQYLMMGLIGLIVATLIGIFIPGQGMSLIISYVGVLLFTGLTAYDTQRIKKMSQAMGAGQDEETLQKVSILGALTLYLDFVNMFLYILRIFGQRD